MVRDSHRSGRRTPKYNRQKLNQKHIYRPDITITQSQVISISASLKNNGACAKRDNIYISQTYIKMTNVALPQQIWQYDHLLAAPTTQGIPTYSTGKG